MQSDLHERARKLIDLACVAGISQDDEFWLHSHTIDCAECGEYAETTARVIHGLGSFSFDIEPGLIMQAKEAITHAAEVVATRRGVRRRFLAGGAVSALLTSIGSWASWEIGPFAAAQIQVSPWVWKLAVTLFSLPSFCVALLLILGWPYLAGSSEEGRRIA